MTLALFLDKVPDITKNQIKIKLEDNFPNTSLIRNSNSIKYNIINGNNDFRSKSLDYFVGVRSRFIFTLLQIDSSFLEQDASLWKDNEQYILAKQTVQKLHVVNDIAERSIGLATTFNLRVTTDEDDRQLLYQNVHQNRKMLPNCNKRNFT